MYIKKYTPELLNIIRYTLRDKDIELEARIKNSETLITNEIFYNTIKRLKGEKNIIHDTDIESLDIIIGDIRFTIMGNENILIYCKNNDIRQVNNKFILITKKSSVKRPIDINEYRLRFNLKREENILFQNKEIKDMLGKWKTLDKIFRYKKRVSFVTNDGLFRFDMTILKSSNKKSENVPNYFIKKKNIKDYMKKYVVKPPHVGNFNEWFDKKDNTEEIEMKGKKNLAMIPTKTMQKSNVLNNPHEYEIELECIANKLPRLPKNIEERTILIRMMNNIAIILQSVQKSYYIISEIEKKNVIDEYKSLLGDYRFQGPMNVTLEKKHMLEKKYEDYQNIVSIRKGYMVTDKADGERNLVIILKNGAMYLMNRKNIIKDIGATCEELAGSILDAEYIVKDIDDKNINLLMVFDIYFYKNEDVRKRILFRYKEEQKDSSIETSRYELLIEAMEIMDNKLQKKRNNTLEIYKKKFYLGDDEDYNKEEEMAIAQNEKELLTMEPDSVLYNNLVEEIRELKCDTKIFMESRKIYYKKYMYKIDGLIYTPRNLFVGEEPNKNKKNMFSGRWFRSFKWKPPEQNSIDFMVKIKKDEKNPKKDQIKYVTINKEIIPYKTLTLLIGYDPSIHTKHNSCRILNENIVFEDKYDFVPFKPSEPYIKDVHLVNIPVKNDNIYTLEDNVIINDDMIIECVYDDTNPYFKWKPIRARDNLRPNDFLTAINVWNCIHNPVTLDMITTGNVKEDDEIELYYNRNMKRSDKICIPMYDLHSYIKKQIIKNNVSGNKNLLDLSVGKAGDINHWIDAGINILVGIDICKDGLINNENGACNRILNKSVSHKKIAENYFIIWADSSKNLTNGNGAKDDLHKYYLDLIYGNISNKNIVSDKLNKLYNLGNVNDGGGFDTVSCQFSIHYFFKDKEILDAFLTNVSMSLKKGGRFIATCLNGSMVFDTLKDDDIISNDGDIMCWKITKRYNNTEFIPDDSSLGIMIDVYNESIGTTFKEYLVNLDYLESICVNYNLKLIENVNFSKMFANLKDMDYGSINNMTEDLKRYSFLNNYVVFEKI